MRTQFLILSIIFLLFIPTKVSPSVVIIYLFNDQIVLTSDSREYITSVGSDTAWYDKSCKIRIFNRYAVAITGTHKGNGPIKFNAWTITENALNKYTFDTAITHLKDEFSKILPQIGDDLGKTSARFSEARPDHQPYILQLGIIGLMDGKLKSYILDFSYYKFNGKSVVVCYERVDIPIKGTVTYRTLGTDLDKENEKYLISHFSSDIYGTMDTIISMVAKKNNTVGGPVNILNVNKLGCQWKKNPTCSK